MQALTKGAMTVFGGDQVRPNIHIDDLVDVYLFALDRRLAGVFNAGFENLSVLDDRADASRARVPADIAVLPSNDPRSYRVCSDRLLGDRLRAGAERRDGDRRDGGGVPRRRSARRAVCPQRHAG